MVRLEVAIVGSGLSGLYCAKCLDDRLSVGLFYSRALVKEKPCGGLVSAEAAALLDAIDIPRDYFHSPAIAVAQIVESGGSRDCELRNVDRRALEAAIAGSLRRTLTVRVEGYRLSREGGAYLIECGGEEYSCAGLVVADGVNSRNRALLGYGPAGSIALEQSRYAGGAERCRLVRLDEVTPGYYYWIVPKGKAFIVGCRPADRARVYGDIAARFPETALGEPLGTERYPVTKLRELGELELGRDRHFLVGEAAGLAMPSSGEGITGALWSAKAAAEVLSSGAAEPNAEYAARLAPLVAAIAGDLGRLP
jgi:flavin-dependent dehydrogenase